MKLVFYFIYVSLILVKVIYGQENTCDVFKNGRCIYTILVGIISDLKTFTISNTNLSGKIEITAECDWIGDHCSCDTKTGIKYNAVSRTEISFSAESGTPCLNGTFILEAKSYGNVPCVEKSDKSELEQSGSESNTDNKEQNTTVCQDDTKEHSGNATGKCHHNPPETDTVNEAQDNTIVAGYVGGFLGGLVTSIVVGILVWIKICRKPMQGPGSNNLTPDSEEKTPQEKTTFLIESEQKDQIKWFRQLSFPGASASGSSAV